MISFHLMIFEIVWKNSFILCLQSTTWDISDFDWTWCWSWSCWLCEKLMIGWDEMNKWDILEMVDHLIISNLSYLPCHLSYRIIISSLSNWKKTNNLINIFISSTISFLLILSHPPSHIFIYLPCHLLSSIVRFDFIYRMDQLLSCLHQNSIKFRSQWCWWELELIHSWEIIKWD